MLLFICKKITNKNPDEETRKKIIVF